MTNIEVLGQLWEAQASDQIIDYIAERNLAAAERLERQFLEKVELACHVPGMGRPGRIAGTREIVVHPNYLIIYHIDDPYLRVIRVLHARQRYP